MLRAQRMAATLLLAALWAAAPAAWAAPPSRVAYTVTVDDIPDKRYRVTARAEGLTGPSVSFAIPAWTPGYYVLADFRKDISNVSATGPDGAARKVVPEDKQTWRVETGGAKSVTLAYDLKATDRNYGFFRAYLDDKNGFVSGPAALMYVVDGTSAPCQVTYRVPAGWKVASANAPTADPYTFTAPDYDTLADQPADLGAFRRHDRTIGGTPFSVVLVGADGADHDAFVDNVFKIAGAGLRVFGGAPFPRYVFHFRFSRRGGAAGLEHLNSTVISLGERALQAPTALSIVAHEFVHAWNVKRVRPAALGPFDYAREVRVKDLWWLEGVTDYYAPRLLVEAGLQDRSYWYAYLARNITELQNNPARRRVTLEQASLKTWEGGSEGFDGLSYYNKGMLVGLLLDVEMRKRTGNRAGLDDLMKRLLRQTQQDGKGFAEGAIEKAASELAGADLGPFFREALRSTAELPFRESLAAAGLELEETVTELPFLGVRWDSPSGADGLRVEEVTPGSAAEKAGLRPGDTVTAVDGKPVASLRGDILRGKKPGAALGVSLQRAGGERASVTATLGKREEKTYRIRERTNATPLQRSIIAAITGSAASAPPAANVARK